MASAADVRVLQEQVKAEQTNIAAAVDACKGTLPQSTLDLWYATALQCLRFVSRDPVFGTVDAMAAEGADLRSQLAAWRESLSGAGCFVPTLRQVPAPPPPGSGRSFWEASGLSDVVPLVLLFLAWDAYRGQK